MAETPNKGKGGAGKQMAKASSRRRYSPMMVGLVALLAVILVGILVAVFYQTLSRPGGSSADAMVEGTRKGPADALVKVEIYSDFR